MFLREEFELSGEAEKDSLVHVIGRSLEGRYHFLRLLSRVDRDGYGEQLTVPVLCSDAHLKALIR